MRRLTAGLVNSLEHNVPVPTYNRKHIAPGILHLGVGAFHRAHQAVYTDEVLNQHGGDWAITGASLRSATVHDELALQDFLYSVCTLSPTSTSVRIIGSITDVLIAQQPVHFKKLIDTIANARTKLVTMTITEKGYCHDTARGGLNENHPDIVYDLSHRDRPRSAPGTLALGLQRRMINDAGPITILSCDNLSNNGEIARSVLGPLAERFDAKLASWMDKNVRFPSSMVDRIVPQATQKDRDRIETLTGYRDASVVVCEPFSQWVIEDNFAAERPRWEDAGATLVGDVTPFERAKLRLLNGSHSALAYLGLLAGHEYVHEAISDPLLGRFIRKLMTEEIAPTVDCPQGFDIDTYQRDIVERFANHAILYRTAQVTMDGSKKLPERLLNTLRDQLRARGSIDCICLVVAAWICYLRGLDDGNKPIEVVDPMADELRGIVARNEDTVTLVEVLFGLEAIFGELSNDRMFSNRVAHWLGELRTHGASACVQRSLQ